MSKSQICIYNNTGLINWGIKLEGDNIVISDSNCRFEIKIYKKSTDYDKLKNYIENYLNLKNTVSLLNERGFVLYFDKDMTPNVNTGGVDNVYDGVLAFISIDVSNKKLIKLDYIKDASILDYDFANGGKILNMCIYFKNRESDNNMTFTFYDAEKKDFTRQILRFKKNSTLILANRDVDGKAEKLDRKDRPELYRVVPKMLSENIVCLKPDMEKLRKVISENVKKFDHKIFTVKKYKDLNAIKGLKCLTVYDPENKFDKEMVNHMKTLVDKLYIYKSRNVYRLK